jgi:hypothetical protein
LFLISSYYYSVCIITAEPVPYGLYIAFKLLMLHILPVIILIITLIKPRTKVSCLCVVVTLIKPRIKVSCATLCSVPSISSSTGSR